MTTNAHILTLNDRLCTIRNIVRSQPDGVEKLTLMTLINDALDHLMEANTDMGNAVRKVAMLSDQISSLSRSIYEPVISTQYRYPEEGDYNAVREYDALCEGDSIPTGAPIKVIGVINEHTLLVEEITPTII